MERKELIAAIGRYNTILGLIKDDRVVAVVTEMLAEARDQLRKMDQIEPLRDRKDEGGLASELHFMSPALANLGQNNPSQHRIRPLGT